jgi:sugar phosphate isomerase/epimerase
MTGYYFPGYPNVPKDELLYSLKRHAFLNGVTITGTGVRNDFALTDASSRRGHIQLVKDWIDVAAKLGSDMVRVFAGKELPKGYSFDQVLQWMIPAFQECAEYGKKNGVIVGLQHHDDFLKTADETIRVVKNVNSEWFSVILDVGSLRQGDPYAEIEKLLPYASNWQIKEHVWYGTKKEDIDLRRVRAIIDKVGYRGFTPIEALGEGDPAEVVTAFSMPPPRDHRRAQLKRDRQSRPNQSKTRLETNLSPYLHNPWTVPLSRDFTKIRRAYVRGGVAPDHTI